MMLSTLARKARNFARRPRFEQAWFVPVWMLLGVSRFIILFVPFRQLAPRLGKHAGVAPWVPLVNFGAEGRARSISRIVQMAAKYTPWTSNCFPQAVAAKVMLGIYGIPNNLFLGVNSDPQANTLKAHAWVVAGQVRVTGGFSFNQFTVVGCFASPAPRP